MATKWTVAIDPPAAIEKRKELSLNALKGINVNFNGIDWGESQIEPFLNVQRFGQTVTDWRVPNRIITIPIGLGMTGGGATAQETARRELEQKVGLLQREGGVLLRQREGGEPMYADIQTAGLTVPDKFAEIGQVEPEVTLKLECLPDFYGEPVELDFVTGNGGYIGVLTSSSKVYEVPGDYPARARLVLKDTSGKNQRSILWGFRSKNYTSAAENKLFYDAYELTTINGSVVVTASESYSGKVVQLSGSEQLVSSPATWQPFLETTISAGEKHLTHVGSYRMFARVHTTLVGQEIRLVWGSDDATAFTYNEAHRLLEGMNLVDLGEVRLEAPPEHEHYWRGVLQLATATQGTIYVDRIWLQPLDDGAGRLRATSVPFSTQLKSGAYPTEAESSATLHAGTAWTTPKGFYKNGVPSPAKCVLTKAGEGSQALYASHFGFKVPSGATIHGIEVSITGRGHNVLTGGVGVTEVGGPVKESTAFVEGFGLPIGGGEETRGGPTDLWGTTWTPAQVNATTFGCIFYAEIATATGAVEFVLEMTLAAIGVYYSLGAGATPPTDAILYGAKHAEVRSEGSFRENEPGGQYARVSEETGSLLRVPPSGTEKREVQLFVKNSRGLIAAPAVNEAGETDPGIDTISAQVYLRPCYLGRI